MFLFRFFGLSISISKIYFFMIWIVNVFVFWLRLSTDAPKLRLQKSNARVLSSNWYGNLAPMFRLKWKIPSIYINKIYSCKFAKCMVIVACTLGRRNIRRYLTYENVHPGIFIDISWSVFNIHKYKLQIQFEKQLEIKSQSVLSFCSKKEHLW